MRIKKIIQWIFLQNKIYFTDKYSTDECNIEEKEFSNDITFSKNILLPPTFESGIAVNFIKNIISNNDIEEESTLKRIIESV